jgi:hypothetical protein
MSAYNHKNQSDAVTQMSEILNKATESTYSAMFAPCVTYQMEEDTAYNNNKTFPASFHYLACAAEAAKNYNEWYAIAGCNRGISKYTIDKVGCVFGEEAINTFSARTDEGVNKAMNLIVKIKNSFYL